MNAGDATLVPLLVAAACLGACASGRRPWTAEALGWGALLLPGLLSALLFGTLATGLTRPAPGGGTIIVTAVIGVAAALVEWLRRRLPDDQAAPAEVRPGPGAWSLFPLAFLGLAVWVAGDWQAPGDPGGSWDSMAIWNVGARFLHRAEGDWPALFAARVTGHPDYPLYLQASLALVWDLLGDEPVAAARSLGLLLLTGLGLLTWTALGRVTTRPLAALAAASLLATPLVAELTRAQVADEAVALALVGAAWGLASRLGPGGVPAPLAGLALGLLPWIKNEGAVLAALTLACWLPCLWRAARRPGGPRPGRELLLVAAGAAPPLAVVLAFRVLWAPADPLYDDLGTTLATHLPDPARWQLAWSGFVEQLDPTADAGRWGLGRSIDRWGLAWPLCGALALVGLLAGRVPRHPGTAFLVLTSLAGLVTYLLIYVVTPVQSQAWHIDTSLFRLLCQLHPLVLLAACALVGGVPPPADEESP